MASTVTSGRAPAASKREILGKIPLFQSASPALRTEIQEAAAIVSLAEGDYFLREGDSCAHFAIVVSGKMRVFKLGENGHEITLYHVGSGEACPLNVACILSDRPVPAMAQVEEAVDAVVVPAAVFRRWIAEHESLRTYVFQMFSNRLAEVMSLVEEVAFRRMDQRVARRLQELFARGNMSQNAIEITHADLAADLGTAREVVSRLLKEFERLGAISLSRGKIQVNDARMLRELASGGAE
jgi:CRP/FNR family transcriptional regulator